ncbi:hypothetical protein DASC09_020000 [Saccharomycopsis crataegensis]|uniref:DH domain-containing protein n=1 Tax=Saccharomycopsis crataegensis TaxID=43959 RepID=A0AAV5QIA4_9ASCO|nr:hypothetical protein DASC09_020000 [Saccharomycopsis crataegensis]
MTTQPVIGDDFCSPIVSALYHNSKEKIKNSECHSNSSTYYENLGPENHEYRLFKYPSNLIQNSITIPSPISDIIVRHSEATASAFLNTPSIVCMKTTESLADPQDFMDKTRNPSLYSRNMFCYIKNNITANSRVSDSTASPNSINITYFPNMNSASQKMALRREKIIEELLKTESSYIEFLKLLSETYTGVIEGSNLGKLSGIPLIDCIERLICEHRKFLFELQRFQSSSPLTGSASPNNSKTLHSTSDEVTSSMLSYGAAIHVSRMIADKAINLFFYEEYFSTIKLASQLLKKLNSTEFHLCKGYEKYLEAVQPRDEKLDLSLLSLLQKPVTRVGKYRLLVESLLETIPENDESIPLVEFELERIKSKLNIMNNFNDDLEKTDITKTLFSRIFFEVDQWSFPVECFGLPLLCGALGCVWRQMSGKLVSQINGIFLFKSTLIVCDIVKEEKYIVKFVIPLCCCKVQDNEATEGLYSTNIGSFKLLFEHNYGLYEISLLGLLKNEIGIWKNKLEMLTKVLYGPYEFDYSVSLSENTVKKMSLIPNRISPVDISLNRFNDSDYNFSDCYFGELVAFRAEFITTDDCNSSMINDEYEEDVGIVECSAKIEFKEQNRSTIEDKLKEVWSMELPKLTKIKKTNSFITMWGHGERKKRRSFNCFRSGTIKISTTIKRVATATNQQQTLKKTY